MVAPPFPTWVWLLFLGLVLALLFLDLFVFHRDAKVVPFGEAMWLSGFWIAVSLAFGGFVWLLAGAEGVIAYVTAYLLEKSLSLDNVFVFSVIFTSFAVPREYRYHVLFYGLIGALEFRGVFVLAGAPEVCHRAYRTYPYEVSREGLAEREDHSRIMSGCAIHPSAWNKSSVLRTSPGRILGSSALQIVNASPREACGLSRRG